MELEEGYDGRRNFLLFLLAFGLVVTIEKEHVGSRGGKGRRPCSRVGRSFPCKCATPPLLSSLFVFM